METPQLEELPECAHTEDLATVRGRLRAALMRAGKEPDYNALRGLCSDAGLKLNKQTVHNWFRVTARTIDSRYLFSVADVLNVSPRWLATGEGTVGQLPPKLAPGAARLIDAYHKAGKTYRSTILAAALAIAQQAQGDSGGEMPEDEWKTGVSPERRRSAR